MRARGISRDSRERDGRGRGGIRRRPAARPLIATVAVVSLLTGSGSPASSAEPGSAGTFEVVVAARDLVFDPDVLRAPAGVELSVLLTNAGVEPHNIAFTLEDGVLIGPEAVSEIIGGGESTSLTFLPPGPGRYGFVCQVHPLEMVGSLRVGAGSATVVPVVEPVPPALADDPRLGPDAMRVTTFAWGLPYATAMLPLSDGSLLVAVNEADDAGLIGSTAKLLRLVDLDADGSADTIDPVGIVAPAGGRGPLVLRELPGAAIQMRALGDLIVMTTRQRARSHVAVLRSGEPGEYLRLLGTITFDYPQEHVHKTYGIALREGPSPGSSEVFFNVGARLNDASDPAPIAVRGLIDGTVTPETIYRLTLTDDGERVEASDLLLIATGVRNGAGMAFHPVTGDLWFQDNGINLDDGSEDQLSADELNVIPAARLGVDVPDFGFPDAYASATTGLAVGSGAEPPVVAFSPREGSQSEGTAEITFAPSGFPTGFDTGVFVGFHGRYGEAGLANEENPVLYVDTDERVVVPFVPNDAPDVGHLDNLVATSDALFLADINRLGPVGAHDPQGVIYQVRAVSLELRDVDG